MLTRAAARATENSSGSRRRGQASRDGQPAPTDLLTNEKICAEIKSPLQPGQEETKEIWGAVDAMRSEQGDTEKPAQSTALIAKRLQHLHHGAKCEDIFVDLPMKLRVHYPSDRLVQHVLQKGNTRTPEDHQAVRFFADGGGLVRYGRPASVSGAPFYVPAGLRTSVLLAFMESHFWDTEALMRPGCVAAVSTGEAWRGICSAGSELVVGNPRESCATDSQAYCKDLLDLFSACTLTSWDRWTKARTEWSTS